MSRDFDGRSVGTASLSRRTAVLGAVAAAVLVGSSGCARGDSAAVPTSSGPARTPDGTPTTRRSTAPTPTPLPPHPTVVATAAVDRVRVYEAPSDPDLAQPGGHLRTLDRTEEVSGQLVFVVIEQGAAWQRVQLPIRPNGSTGWLRAQDVVLARHDYGIAVDRTRREITVARNGTPVLVDEVGLGRDATPTPDGTYYIKELLRPPDLDGVYGPYAYGLSGFSTVLESFAGGDGVIGIHGTDQPHLLGRDVSHGCIRLRNDVVVRLVEEIGLPLGTPVLIV